MAKIIDRRPWPRKETYRHTCPRCRSFIEYTPEDIVHPTDDLYPCQQSEPWVECPVCSKQIDWKAVAG